VTSETSTDLGSTIIELFTLSTYPGEPAAARVLGHGARGYRDSHVAAEALKRGTAGRQPRPWLRAAAAVEDSTVMCQEIAEVAAVLRIT
jgi:hypothetical protein